MITRHRRRTTAKLATTAPIENSPSKQQPPLFILPAQVINNQRAWSSPFIVMKLKN